MNRYTLALLLTLFLNSVGLAQISLDAPKEVATGKKIVVKVVIEKGKDLRYAVLKDGKEFKDFLAFKDLADDKPIILITDTENGTYTVIASVNDANKTFQALSFTQVGPVKPDDPKKPDAPVSGLDKEVKALYDAAPDAATLDSLVQVFADIRTAVAAGKYKTFGDFETSIVATTNDRVKDAAKLRKIRDRLGDYLIEKTGTDPRTWNKDKATAVCDDILAALKAAK